MKNLPQFKKQSPNSLKAYLNQVLNDQVRDVMPYPDNHYRVIFNQAYFTLTDDHIEPTKSQWNTLKKKFKRIQPDVFVFKDHGSTTRDDQPCYYVDLGFFAD